MARILGERIMLRDYKESDIECIREWINDHETTRLLASGLRIYPQSYAQTEQFVRENMQSGGPEFVIADIDTEQYIGQINLMDIDYCQRSCRIGIVIGNPDFRSLGYGSEALRLMLKFAFEQLNMNRVEIRAFDYNKAAYNCYIKLGFVEEGRLRQAVYCDGQYHDIIILSYLRQDYDK